MTADDMVIEVELEGQGVLVGVLGWSPMDSPNGVENDSRNVWESAKGSKAPGNGSGSDRKLPKGDSRKEETKSGVGKEDSNQGTTVLRRVRASNGLYYESNPKHTVGRNGSRPNTGIETENALQLFSNLVQSTRYPKQRFAYDKLTGIVHRFFNDGNEVGSEFSYIKLALSYIWGITHEEQSGKRNNKHIEREQELYT